MHKTDQEIIIAIVASSLFLLMLVIIIIVSVLRYKTKQQEYKKRMIEIKEGHEKEILKVNIEVKEQTLLNIAHEIHDNVGQILSLVKLNLNMLIHKIENEDINMKLKYSIQLTTKAISDLRDLSSTMNSEYLKNQPLSVLLKAELDKLEKNGGYLTSLIVYGEERELDAEKQIILYRMVQEVSTNIIKHADASTIDIIVNYENPLFIEINIKDNGKGFNLSQKSNGNGLYNLKYRSELIDSEFSMDSEVDKGTVVNFKVKSI